MFLHLLWVVLVTLGWTFPSVWNQALSSGDGLCRYGGVIRCCYGWTRDKEGACRPVCRQPCQHGVCIGFNLCECDKGYTGTSCERDENECAHTPCQHRCMNSIGSYRCYCREGYLLESDRRSCRPDNECKKSKCHFGCEQKSISKRSHCTCPKGMQLSSDNKICQDINECEAENPQSCPPGRKCQNTFGSYMCMCPDGYSFQYVNGKLQCQPVEELVPEVPIDVCSQGNNECSPNAACYPLASGFDYSCTCNDGFIGDGRECSPVDLTRCDDSPCFPSVTCTDLEFSNDVPGRVEDYILENGEIKLYQCGECPSQFVGNGSVCSRISRELEVAETKISRQITVIVNDNNYISRPVRNANVKAKLKNQDYTANYAEGSTSNDGIVVLPLPVSDEMVLLTLSHPNFFDTSLTLKPYKEHNNIVSIVVHQRENGETEEFVVSENTLSISFLSSPYTFLIKQESFSGVELGDRIEANLYSANFKDENSLEGIPELIAIVPAAGGTKYGYLEAVAIIKLELTNLRSGEPVNFIDAISAIVPLQKEVFHLDEFGSILSLWAYDNEKGIWVDDVNGIVREVSSEQTLWYTPLRTSSWVAAGRPWPDDQLQCVGIVTCLDGSCLQRRPYVQIWVTGLDHWYKTIRTTDKNGRTCINLLEGREYLFKSCYTQVKMTIRSPPSGGGRAQAGACPLGDGGQWQETDTSSGTCFEFSMFASEEPVVCEKPEEINKATKSSEDFYFGANVNYTCFAGHRMIGTSQRVCQGCGEWSGSQPYCFQ